MSDTQLLVERDRLEPWTVAVDPNDIDEVRAIERSVAKRVENLAHELGELGKSMLVPWSDE